MEKTPKMHTFGTKIFRILQDLLSFVQIYMVQTFHMQR